MKTQDLACSLNGSDLIERVAAWKSLAARATRRHVESGRVVSTYPADPLIRHELDALIAAEAQCCSFMQFTIDDAGDELVVELRVPEEMSEMLGVMLGLVTQQ